uniref:Uncharacterized protein n=1 Tax=Plectus sambesii TaxID=2011161 RepID=A0A914UUJ4_9BILA
MRRQHAARTVGGTGIISCPPDFGAERHRRRRHRPAISPQPGTTLLRPPEEQSHRSDTHNNGGKRHDTRKATSHYSSELHQTTPSMQPANKAMRKSRNGETCAHAEINKSHTKARIAISNQSTYKARHEHNYCKSTTTSGHKQPIQRPLFTPRVNDSLTNCGTALQPNIVGEQANETALQPNIVGEQANETALQPNIVGEQARPRSSRTSSASKQTRPRSSRTPSASMRDRAPARRRRRACSGPARPPRVMRSAPTHLRCATAASSQVTSPPFLNQPGNKTATVHHDCQISASSTGTQTIRRPCKHSKKTTQNSPRPRGPYLRALRCSRTIQKWEAIGPRRLREPGHYA